MPRRADIHSILLIGSGPIVIGQACEFDYSGTQAAKALRAEGYRVVLVNSNPATIMTDPEFADATYLEPITPEIVERIIERESPDALLPTLGGQTALNVTAELARSGVLDAHGVELIGAGFDAIERAEDRGLFKKTMAAAGIESPRSRYARSMREAITAAGEIGYPVMVRPSFILGGGGTGVASDEEAFLGIARRGLEASPVAEILVEESVVGWKEFELEVMADRMGNAVIVCSIENLDPMGVHTGDSITVAPIQTLSDREYQEMRDEAITCLRAIGVQTGGSNVQFAVDPSDGRRLIIEMNPRVSRSSALASKATGFPIAKIAALLAVGYTLDEIANDITAATPACFEPVLDYTVVKIPRFDFAKFPSAPDLLGTSMRSVGEAMAIGRTFPEALQKALRSLEVGRYGLNADPGERTVRGLSDEQLAASVGTPTSGRIFQVAEALRRGWSVEGLGRATGIDPWFLDQMAEVCEVRAELEDAAAPEAGLVRQAKRMGFSDAQLGYLWQRPEIEIREFRRSCGIRPTYKRVDTCAAEFEARTPYFYSTYEDESEVEDSDRPRVVILGSGPNRIGQGIEFDYCCVHASFALREAGYETVMVNCNPETVSTDYDTSDRLYFEPLTVEDVLEICDAENPVAVVVQLGGQTPLNLAWRLEDQGVPIAGTAPDRIDAAEDRERFSALCRELAIAQPPHGTATSPSEAREVVDRIGFPALVRPSYVLGGRAMRVVYSHRELGDYLGDLYGTDQQSGLDMLAAPVLIDRFLEAAVEVDVDAIYDGRDLLVGGIMEHVEEAGVHSGDSACITPPPTISGVARKAIVEATGDLAQALEVRGLVNIQFAVKGDDIFLLEANPRGSRTVPFISKASGVPLAKLASRVMVGATLRQLASDGLYAGPADSRFVAVKEAVLPWDRFPEEDTILGPEMRATGEVMGIGRGAGVAYAKAMMAAGTAIPVSGTVFLSFADRDKPAGAAVASALDALGFRLLASPGTAEYLRRDGLIAEPVHKVGEGPNDTVQRIETGELDLIINTPQGRRARGDGHLMRRAAWSLRVPIVTTVAGAEAVIRSLRSSPEAVYDVRSLQDWHV
ncbi:MAG: carbamoyl-phosphate synthase large subunit [bacterium]|nr:carbamoyl-phosphate synthase large subunit [bacterium]MDE0288397.1 carbamoyl-phosphate synthase large subunit [bacterium]MDE0438725.1 carbamoyl-phosphate synthase large subunit [bacterium]